MADPVWYRSSFGDLRLWLSKISTDRSRTIVVQELSSGDEHVVQDRGRGPVRARCTVLFATMMGDDLEPLERCRRLQAIVDDKPRIFSHPSSGSYLARVGPFTEDIDGAGVITADIEVIRVAPLEPLSPGGTGSIPSTGEGAVDEAADALTTELADLGLTSTLPDEAKAAVASWNADETVNSRAVLTQVGTLTSKTSTESAAHEKDLESWSVFRRYVQLGEAIRSAATAALQGDAETFLVQLAAPTALRAVLASIYPAEEAGTRYDQVMALNDLSTPAWIEPGTQLLMPALTAVSRSG